jgi:hypothetical protein
LIRKFIVKDMWLNSKRYMISNLLRHILAF